MYSKQVNELLSREVSRAEFIKYIGLALLGVTGITNFVKNLHQNVLSSPKSKTALAKQLSDYGMSAYGR